MSDSIWNRSLFPMLGRYRQIFQILLKYGFWDLCSLAHLQGLLKIVPGEFAAEAQEMADRPLPERIRLALEELGPTFVKAGQLLSSRRDVIDDALYRELRKLQQEVKPVPWEEIKTAAVAELGRPLEDIFISVEETPLASASIAQVHRALLRDGAIPVIIKIRRPGLRRLVDGDIEIMRHFAGFLEKHVERSRIFDPPALVEDFGRSLRRELDFEWEADQQREFARSLQEVPALIVPRVFHGSESLLVMEYVNGLPVDQPDLLRAAGIAPTAAAEIMSDIVFRMILLTGFFHADPHPGNLAITPQGQLVFYDFGWMGRYSEHFREQLALGLHGLAQHDGNRLTEAVLGMSLTGHVDDPAELQEDLALFSCEYLDCPLAEVNLEETLNRLLEILREHRLHMRSEFYLGVKALCQVEAIARALHPEINYVQFGEPYAKQVLEKKFSLREVGKNLYWGGVELMGFLKELPLELRNVFSRFKKGELQIPVRHEIDPVGFEPLRTTMNHIANRLATALLAAALLITAGLLLHAASKEGGRSLSILGHTALVLGGFLGLRLIWRMWRRGGT